MDNQKVVVELNVAINGKLLQIKQPRFKLFDTVFVFEDGKLHEVVVFGIENTILRHNKEQSIQYLIDTNDDFFKQPVNPHSAGLLFKITSESKLFSSREEFLNSTIK